jgi:hypothetical protein
MRKSETERKVSKQALAEWERKPAGQGEIKVVSQSDECVGKAQEMASERIPEQGDPTGRSWGGGMGVANIEEVNTLHFFFF